MNGTIYAIKCKINGKLYIGQTKRTIEERFKSHMYSYGSKFNKNTLISKAFVDFGYENFEIFAIEDGIITQKDLDEKESYYIEKYSSLFPNGYNVSPGANHYRRKPLVSESDVLCMIEMYESGKSARVIAEKFGISKNTVTYHLKNNNCELRKKNFNLPNRKSEITEDVMIDLYINKKLKIKEIAEILSVDVRTINRAKNRFQLKR